MITAWMFVILTSMSPVQVGPFTSQEICDEARHDIRQTLFASQPLNVSRCYPILIKVN